MSDRSCVVDGCTTPTKRIVLGMCSMHYQRNLLHGSTDERPKQTWRFCAQPECPRRANNSGYCNRHQDGTLFDIAVPIHWKTRPGQIDHYCVYPNCSRPHKARGLCNEHLVDTDWNIYGTVCIEPKCSRAALTRDLCVRHVHFRYMNMRRFNMTLDQFDALSVRQGGVCAICAQPDPRGTRLHVDHNHACCPNKGESCGRCVRGLLCGPCNHLLGNAQDNVERLQAAVAYLATRPLRGDTLA